MYESANLFHSCRTFYYLLATLAVTTGLRWLLMLSISSFAYLLLCISEKMTDLFLISHLSYVFVLLSCKSAGNRLQIKSLLIYHLFSYSLVSLSWWCPSNTNISNFDEAQFELFSLCFGLLTTHNKVFPNLRSAFILIFSSWGSMILVTLGPDSSKANFARGTASSSLYAWLNGSTGTT